MSGTLQTGHSIYSAGEQISTLEEAVSLCDELDLIVFLDVKPFKTEKVLNVHTHHCHSSVFDVTLSV